MHPRTRILLTGGSGLLAVNWAMHARNRCDVVLVFHSRVIAINGVNSVQLDLCQPDALNDILAKFKPDYVVHTAGLTSVEQCEKNPELARQINAVATQNVARSSKLHNTKLVHISTDHVFNGQSPLSTEEAEPHPINTYALTKLQAERTALEECPNALVLRTNFFAWGPKYRQSFSDYILEQLRHERSLSLFDDVYYTPILVETLVHCAEALIAKNQHGIFNVVGDERLSKYEFGLKLAQAIGANTDLIKRSSILDRLELVQRPKDMSLSNHKLQQVLGHGVGNCAHFIDRLLTQERPDFSGEIQKL